MGMSGGGRGGGVGDSKGDRDGEQEREMVKETLMNADNKEPNLSSEPLETDRFLTGSIKALDRVCVGLPFKHPLSCSGRTYCSRLGMFGALNHGNSELWDTDAVCPGWLCAEAMQNPMNPCLHEECNGANECG